MKQSSLLTLAFAVALMPPNVTGQGSPALCDCSSFFLTAIGQVTSLPSEVISGSRSIKGSYAGAAAFTPYLRSKQVLPLLPSNTYRIAFRYRILVTPSRGFETLFYSPTGGNAGNFLPSTTITGNAGDSGTATLTNTLGRYSDYEARWNIVGTGAISIDDIQIVNVTTGLTVATEDAELVDSPIQNVQPPSGLLAPGSNSIAISFQTAQATNCGYSLGTAISLNSMTPLGLSSSTTRHQGTVSGLSSDTRVLNHVYIRCASNPDYVHSLVYRTVARPGGEFPRIGNIWIGNYLYQNKPEQAKKIQLFLGPDGMSAADASALRSSNPDVIILPSIQVDDAFDLTLPESYYLHDTKGKRISDWPGSYIYNMTRPEVATYVGKQANQFLEQSNWVFDGIFFDSFGTSKGVNMVDASGNAVQIDADGDGFPDDQDWLNSAWAAGEYLVVSTFRSMTPGAYVSGHVGEAPAQVASLGTFNATSIVFDAVDVREAMTAFDTLWNLYRTWETQAVSPVMTMVQSSPPNQLAYGYGYFPLKALLPATTQFAQTFYPNMRFGLALTLMNDGFFTHDFGDTGGGSPLTWWYDEYDFNLGYPVGPATQIGTQSSANLIANSGFEGGLSGWQFNVSDDGQGRATAAADRVVVADGGASAHLTITAAGTANWHIELEQGGLPLTAGTTYSVQFWARADSPRKIAVFSQGGAPNFPNYGLFAQIPISTSWSLYSASFISTSTAKDGRLEFWVGDVPGNVWLDNVALFEAPPQLYRRDYTNGIVLLNGTPSPQTVSPGAGFKRFSGTQAPLYQYIVDDSDSSFSGTGTWSTVTYDTGAYSPAGSSANLPSKPQNANGPFYHCWQGSCHSLDSGSGQAQWSLQVPADGQYSIQVWLPAAPNSASWTKSAVYEVIARENVLASATLDQTTASAGDAWHAIATVTLRTADAPVLRIRNGGSGTLIADAVYITSAALYNDGSPTQQLTLAGFDGILLQRQQAVQMPTSRVNAVVNAANYQPAIASGAFVSIMGTGFVTSSRSWMGSDFQGANLPIALDGVSVSINGKTAYVEFISPTQINAIVPDDDTIGQVPIQVTTAQGSSYAGAVLKQKLSPGLFSYPSGKINYAAAIHLDGTLVGPTGPTSRPAAPGEVIEIYGTGFGATAPAMPTSQLVSQAAPTTLLVTITIGDVAAEVQWAGLVSSGLYQLNVKIPALAAGDQPVQTSISGFQSPPTVMLAIGNQ